MNFKECAMACAKNEACQGILLKAVDTNLITEGLFKLARSFCFFFNLNSTFNFSVDVEDDNFSKVCIHVQRNAAFEFGGGQV